MNMNEQNRHTDYLNMMSAPNYSNFTAHQEAQHEHDNRWVCDPQTENGHHTSTDANHQQFSAKDFVRTK
jgi:hypothetical protein